MFKFRRQVRWFVPPPKGGNLKRHNKRLIAYDCVRLCKECHRPYFQAIYKEFSREMARRHENTNLIELFGLLQELVWKEYIFVEKGTIPTRYSRFKTGMRFSPFSRQR